ncbi:transcriptional regulator, MarR family protein [Pedobacter sp. BAL39]|nr:transcriptional regulator, MarR family protein [Pedobacter sp. BAL39]
MVLTLTTEILIINYIKMDNIEKKNWGGEECPITLFMEQIGGKWKPVILWLLFQEETMRFSELDKSISGITQKMLSQQLKGLEETGTIKRVSYPVIPPKVEYSLTEKGKSLFSILDGLCKWSENNLSR